MGRRGSVEIAGSRSRFKIQKRTVHGVTARTVEAYIASAPRSVRAKLKELRAAIRKAAPKAQEKISYRMPYYHYKGRLAYFCLHRAHIGLYIPTPVVAEHKRELKGYYAAGATIRFDLDQKIPTSLVQKLVKARLKKNEAKKKAK